MQGHTWSSNQRPPPQYQERFPPRYQDVRNEAQFNGQFPRTAQTRYCNGQQEATHQRNMRSCNEDSFGPAFQPNSHGYDRQTNWAHQQFQPTAFNTQQQYPCENSMRQGAFRTQSCASTPQNYRNTGHRQDAMYWSQQSNYGGSVGNSRGWTNHMPNNGNSCQMNNQQQIQRMTPVHHHHHQQQRQQWPSRRHSGKKQNIYQSTRGQSSSSGNSNQTQSQTAACYTSGNSTTTPSDAQIKISLPSNNLNQSPVNQNQTEPQKLNAGPDILVSQNNQSAVHQSQSINNVTYQMRPTNAAQSTNNGIYAVNQTSQMRPTIESQSLNNEVHNSFQTSQIRPNLEAQSLHNGIYNINQSHQMNPTTEVQSLNNGIYNVNHTTQIKPTTEAQSLNNGIYNVNQTSQMIPTLEAQSLNNGIYNVNQTSQMRPTTEAQSLNNRIYNVNQTSQMIPITEAQSLNNGMYIVNQTSQMRQTTEVQSLNNGRNNVNQSSQMKPTTEAQSLNNGVYNVNQTSQMIQTIEPQSSNNGIYNVNQSSQMKPTTEAQSLNNGIYNVNQTSQMIQTIEPQSSNNGIYNVNQTSQMIKTIEPQSSNNGIYIVNQTSQMRPTSEAQSMNNGIYNVIVISPTRPTNQAQSTNNDIYEIIQISQERPTSETQSTNNGIFNVNQTSQTQPTNEAHSTNNEIYNNQNPQTRLTKTAQVQPHSKYTKDSLIYKLLCPEIQSLNGGNLTSQTRPANEVQSPNNEIYNVNQTSQMRQTKNTQLQPHPKYSKDSLIYKLLFSKRTDSEEQEFMQQSNEIISHTNTCPERTEVCATNRTDNHSKEVFSVPSTHCAAEPPSKRMKYGVVQRDYWNKEASMSKDRSDLSGAHQMGSNEQTQNRTSQPTIQYSTDPADCLEAVFALQKAAQQGHKAIAIVPPISQQIPNVTQIDDPKNPDSPPLKIDHVWSLVKESDAQETVNDKLSEPSSQTEQEDESTDNEPARNETDPDTFSTSPVECQNDMQQGDSDLGDSSVDLQSVPVIKHTLENLMDLVKSLEMTESSVGYPEQSGCVLSKILELFWNGNQENILKPLKEFRNEMMLDSFLKEIIEDSKFVVCESIETENLKKLAHCDILNNEVCSSSEEFRSSWLNVDGQPVDIEKVLSEPFLNDMTVFKTVPQSFSSNTGATSTTLGVNSLKDLPEVTPSEKSVKPDASNPRDLFTPQSGNDTKEMASENNGHSYVIKSLDNIYSKKEIPKEQKNNNQNLTKPSDFSTSANTVELTDKESEVSIQGRSGQTHDNALLLDSLPNSCGGNVSDGVKRPEVSLSTQTFCNSTHAWQVENISDDENPGDKEALNNTADNWLLEDISDDENPSNKEALNNSADTWLIEDISNDENPSNKDALNNSADTWLLEDISNDENPSNKEALNNSADTWLVEDISDDDNLGNKEVPSNASDKGQNHIPEDTASNSSDLCVVEDVFNDENSSDDSLLMEVTVLSSEDAKTLFQELEDEPTISVEPTIFDSVEFVACFDVPKEPKNENKADTCSRCSKMLLPNTTSVFTMDSDGDHFCNECWEQAPLLELDEVPFSPSRKNANVQDFAAKSDKQDQHCFPPYFELETKEQAVASTDKGPTGQKHSSMVESDLEDNCSSPSGPTGQTIGSMVESDLEDNCSSPSGPTGQTIGSMVESDLEDNCSSPSGPSGQTIGSMVESDLEDNCSSPSETTGQTIGSMVESDQEDNCSSPSGPTGQTIGSMVESDLEDNCSSPSGPTGQTIGSMVESDLEDNCSSTAPTSPSPEPKFTESTVTVTAECIVHDEKFTESTVTVTAECIVHDEGLTGQTSDFMVTSEHGQNCSLTTNELEVMEPHNSSPETCIAEEQFTGQTSDRLDLGQSCPPHLELQVIEPTEVCLKQEQNHISQCLGLQAKEPIVASTKVCIEGLDGQKSHSETTSQLEQNHSPPCLDLASPEPCIATNIMTEQKCDFMEKLQLRQNWSMPCLEPEVNKPDASSSDKCISGNEVQRQRNYSMVKSVTKTMHKSKKSAKKGLSKSKSNKQKNEKTKKIRLPKPQPLLQSNKPHKAVFSNHKRVSCSTSTDSAVPELFTPDIVVKKNCPQKKNVPVVPSNKRPGVESPNCNKTKKFKVHKQASEDRTSTNHQENLQKVPDHSNEMLLHESKTKPEPQSILSVNKAKTMEPKKVRFDLYGSKGEKQCYASERRFSAPATLTISDSCNEYTDVISAKQKVHNLWSSTFIPKTKRLTSKREGQVVQQEESPPKKKQQNIRTQDILKSNMSALRSQLTHRAMLVASSEKEPSHFRKPAFQQKLTKTLSI